MKAWIFTTSFICDEKSGWKTLKTDHCAVRNQIILTIKIYKSSGFDFKLTWSLKYCRRSLYFLRAWCILTIDWIYRKTSYILLKYSIFAGVKGQNPIIRAWHLQHNPDILLCKKCGSFIPSECVMLLLTLTASSVWSFRYCFLLLYFFLSLKPLQWAYNSNRTRRSWLAWPKTHWCYSCHCLH